MQFVHSTHSARRVSIGQRLVKHTALGLLTVGAFAASADEHTVTVQETVQLTAAPAKTWDTIKDFSTWQLWHPAFAGTELVKGEGHTKGAVRVLSTKDGGKFTEELVAYDAGSRSFKYRIIESPAPVTGYVSTIEVRPSNGGSSVVWSSTFKVKPGTPEDDAKKLISGVYRAGLDNLASAVR
jgi:hypothetical protein